MGRCVGMASCVMAIVFLVALFASSAECRPEPLNETSSSMNSNGGGGGGDASMALNVNSTAGNGRGPPSPVSLVFCIQRSCVYSGRGNAPCFCCATSKPLDCYDTRDQCNSNCV